MSSVSLNYNWKNGYYSNLPKIKIFASLIFTLCLVCIFGIVMGIYGIELDLSYFNLIFFCSYAFFFIILGLMGLNWFVVIPPDSVGMYYNNLTGQVVVLGTGVNFSLMNIFLSERKNYFKEKYTHIVDLRSYADPIEDYQILTQTNLCLRITGLALVKMIDPKKAFNSTSNIDQTIDSLCKAELRHHFSKITTEQIIQTQDLIEEKLTKTLNKDLIDYGTVIEKFIISSVELPDTVTEAITKITAKETQYKCKIKEVDNKYLITESELKIKALEQQEKRKIESKKLEDLIKREELKNNLIINHLRNLKKEGVEIKDYIKYINYTKVKGGINIIDIIENPNSDKKITLPIEIKEQNYNSGNSVEKKKKEQILEPIEQKNIEEILE